MQKEKRKKVFKNLTSIPPMVVITFLLSITVLFFCKDKIWRFLSPSERHFVKLMDHVLIRECGIYTLMDIKPLTLIDLSYIPPTDEEKFMIWNEHSTEFKMKYSVDDLSYLSLNLPNIWKKWRKIESQFLGSKYRFVPNENGFVYFINVPACRGVLKDNFDLVKQILDSKCSTQEIVDSIGNEASPIWKEISSEHVIRGLLFGYGRQNAQNFETRGDKKKNNSTKYTKVVFENRPKIESLNIPMFCVFEGGEAQVEMYKRAREDILDLLKNVDFYQFTKKRLRENSSISNLPSSKQVSTSH